jgi:hypothetical protein
VLAQGDAVHVSQDEPEGIIWIALRSRRRRPSEHRVRENAHINRAR